MSITLPTIERLPAVMKRTGLKKSTLYNLMNANKFPKSVPLTDGGTRGSARGWDSRAVSAWIEKRIAVAALAA
jgi:predicted DNA-binding transcriptional regulator AlpA